MVAGRELPGAKTLLLLLATAFAPALGAAELPGIMFHAERFSSNAPVVQDETAYGGKAVRGTRWYFFCRDVPFPQGDGEYHVYVRAKSEGADNPIHLGTFQQEKLKIVAALPPPPPGKWTWVRFAPLSAGAVGSRFAMHGGGQNHSQWTMLDGIVIARSPSLSPETLDQAMRATPEPAGILAAPRLAAPPVIDGLLDDACYAQAPEAFPFARLGQPRFAAAQTRVSALWDDTNLYIAAQLHDPVLDPAGNRLGDFRKTVAQHDGPVWNDDCIEVFIDPTCEGRDYYQFVVNALGTIYDARGQDARFESGAVAAARVGEGRWTMELAVPLKSLGIRAPSKGVVLGVNFARERYGEKELSSWSPLTRFAEPEGFGRVVLVEAAPAAGLRVDKCDLFRFGENVVSFTAGAKAAITAFAEARIERQKPVRSFASGPSPLELKYTLAESGRAVSQFLVMDNAGGMPLYRSPQYAGEVAGTSAQIALKSDGGIEVFCNGEAVSAPSDREARAGVPLVDGLNALAVRCSGATLAGVVRAGAFEYPVDATWRWTAEASAVSKDLDLDTLQKVAVEGDGIRAPASGGVFRKSLAMNVTRAWPNYGEAMYLAQGAAQWFHLRLKGIRGLPAARKPVIVVDVPEGIELVDGAGFYGKKRKEQPRFTREPRGRATVGNETFERTAFRSDLPMRTTERVGVLNLFSVVVRVREDGPLKPGGEARLFYHLEDCDGAVVEPPRALAVRIAEPLRGVQPKHVTLQCWPGWLSTYDGDAGMDALLQTIARAGFNDVTLGADAAAAHRHRLRTTALIGFESWILDLAPYVKEHPGEALLDANGKPAARFVCTTRLLGPAWDGFVDSAIAAWLDRVAPDHVNWDYESSAFTGYLVCYDERCLEAFRKFAKLPDNAPLTPDVVRKEHKETWLDFMAGRSSEVARRFAESIRKHRPAAIFSMYSGYQSSETKEIYNVDWRLCAPHLDLVMCGYGRREDEVAATRKAAGSTPCVFGSITHPYEFDDDSATSVITAAEVLRRLCDAVASPVAPGSRRAMPGGVLFYCLSNADARTLLSFAKASRVAAECEEFFVRGAADRSGFRIISGKDSDAYVFSLGARKLLCLLNETGKPARFEVECPAAAKDFFSKAPVQDPRLCADIPGGDIMVYLFGD